MSLYLSGLMKPQRSSVPTTLVHVALSVGAVESASLPTAAGLCFCSPAEGRAPAESPDIECGPHRGALPGIFKHSQPRTFLAGHLPHPTPSVSHCPRALPRAWTTQASASSRQARSSLPDVSSLENQTIKGIAQRDKGRLFPQAWILSGGWLHGQNSPA